MNRFTTIIVGAALGGLLAGCGGVSEVTKERVDRSAAVVQQSQATVGNSEAGAIDMQRAKELLDSARNQMRERNGEAAERLASEAQLTSELAVAKTQNAQARKAADELTASLESLRREAARAPGATSSPTNTP